MAEERKRLTVGLFKKNDQNKLDDYIDMTVDPVGINIPEMTKGFEDMVNIKLLQMK